MRKKKKHYLGTLTFQTIITDRRQWWFMVAVVLHWRSQGRKDKNTSFNSKITKYPTRKQDIITIGSHSQDTPSFQLFYPILDLHPNPTCELTKLPLHTQNNTRWFTCMMIIHHSRKHLSMVWWVVNFLFTKLSTLCLVFIPTPHQNYQIIPNTHIKITKLSPTL